MAFDPYREDYQRLGLRFAHTLQDRDPFGAARAASGFRRRYQTARDTLPQSDADRAFHLVVQATDLIDYRLPFASEDSFEPMVKSASDLLTEALDLDQHCHDARRMQAAGNSLTCDAYYHFLADGIADVREHCLAARDRAAKDRVQPNLASELALRPYLRWASALATKAVASGRYRKAVEVSREIMALDPNDASDARFTCAYAYAKLEDEEGLSDLNRTFSRSRVNRPSADAWSLIARMSVAFKRLDLNDARKHLTLLLSSYPHAADALLRQDEYPDGVYARLAVQPGSEDELILAVSEGAVLLQEGLEELEGVPFGEPPAEDALHTGALGNWVMHEPAVRTAAERDAARHGRQAPTRQASRNESED